MERSGYDGDATGRQRSWKDDPDDIDIMRMVFQLRRETIDVEIQAIDVSPLLFVREIEIRSAVDQQLLAKGRAVVLVSVWPEVHPDEKKCIRRMVCVLHFDKTVKAAVFGIQC